MKLVNDVVMLYTDEKASYNGLVINPSTDKIQYNDSISKKGAEYYTSAGFTYNHIYITSNEEIKEGDWCIQNRNYLCKITCNQDRTQQGLKKIIATTDDTLTFKDDVHIRYLPTLSDGFIKKFINSYNTRNHITNVMVEYEMRCRQYNENNALLCFYNCPTPNDCQKMPYLKIDENNCIIITDFKDKWTREEVVDKIYEVLKATGNKIKATMHNIGTNSAYIEYDRDDLEEWISENL